ncbi:ABC transporter substrate-binding protein [Brevibacillus agri]|uniref:ABC transporter substrate-binding protein n=1 Tax=Brevibacillus agri TaxID=51101 RepID=A0A3M8B4K3_9BACL|nr:transporter substrate-binding domain-containing protein [Brevibacillus agri]ELK39826.1 amino acid ABC transporter substrate-binding protein [Brevibacillus agri BAB-2500]QAV14523.1 amino acid ABC transporter substrate-binding protein [Brevibacillus agri]RNB58212.1 amino acid ABC transporter substrate-binding protein [Brevibacillus agri]GED25393.1 ABC transporter substrate-binding protein [Brevibacillus agri]
MKKSLKAVAGVLFSLSLLVAGCSQGASTNDGGGQAGAASGNASAMTKEAGVFVFAASGEYQPFSYFKDGQLTGFDIEIGNEIAKRLNLQPKPVTSPFSGIIAGVKEGRYDAAIASHAITEERKQQIDFADPYYLSGGQLFTRPDGTTSTLEELKGKEVAVALGTTHEKMAREYTDNIKTYDSDVTALRALEQGKHDVVITDSVVGEIAIAQGLKIKKSGAPLSEVQHGIAVRKGNSELLNKINEVLKQMHEDGTYLKLSEKYFNRDISKNE